MLFVDRDLLDIQGVVDFAQYNESDDSVGILGDVDVAGLKLLMEFLGGLLVRRQIGKSRYASESLGGGAVHGLDVVNVVLSGGANPSRTLACSGIGHCVASG